jgi:hypothetical protein
MSKDDLVSLETLGQGAAVERFNLELQRALDNIADENTKAKGTREVTLKVKITPDEDREIAKVEVHTTSKLQAYLPFPTQFVLGKQAGKACATEFNPRQKTIPDAIKETATNVVSMDRTPEKKG